MIHSYTYIYIVSDVISLKNLTKQKSLVLCSHILMIRKKNRDPNPFTVKTINSFYFSAFSQNDQNLRSHARLSDDQSVQILMAYI